MIRATSFLRVSCSLSSFSVARQRGQRSTFGYSSSPFSSLSSSSVNTRIFSFPSPSSSLTSSSPFFFRKETSLAFTESDLFGDSVLTDEILRSLIGYDTFEKFKEFRKHPDSFDITVADQCANAMKTWALSKGVTHYTHWFQPLSGVSAAKCNNFLKKGTGDDKPLLSFSGKDLMKGEIDSSSFPSGGIRSLFEARGYTIWDMNSPPFIRQHKNSATLVIPTAFVSWSGQTLDIKTPLLRSEAAINRESLRLLHLLGEKDVVSVESILGAEQEFFLVDKKNYDKRPDLVITGRTLFSGPPPRGQDLEDHYYGKMPPRVLNMLHETEMALWKMGVPTKTRHAEVAPGQFEICPIHESSPLACDHNLLLIEVLCETAKKHNLIALVHEKPFAYINGSGKHSNWSLSVETQDGAKTSLFQPGDEPASNRRFMIFLVAVLRAFDIHAPLVRASVACPGNDYRLGRNEAPPDIMSVYLGDVLHQICKRLVGESDIPAGARGDLKLGTISLPPLPRDSTDRNRTSPFAFTSDRFEFRAVGSGQTVASIVTLFNTITADAIKSIGDEIEQKVKEGKKIEDACHSVVVKNLKQHFRIVYNGDNYSENWLQEAKIRGLQLQRTAPEALAVYNSPNNVRVFSRMGVLSEVENESRRVVINQSFMRHLTIEVRTMVALLDSKIIPAGLKMQTEVAKAINITSKTLSDKLDPEEAEKILEPQTERLKKISKNVSRLIELTETNRKLFKEGEEVSTSPYLDPHTVFAEFHPRYTDALRITRELVDELESLSDNWPFPRYSDLLYLV